MTRSKSQRRGIEMGRERKWVEKRRRWGGHAFDRIIRILPGKHLISLTAFLGISVTV